MPDMRTYPQKARDRITGSKIITRLMKHVNGEIDMSPTQVRAASILLNKVLPDLRTIEVDIHTEVKNVSYHRLTDEQLMAIATSKFQPEVIDGEVVSTPQKLEAL